MIQLFRSIFKKIKDLSNRVVKIEIHIAELSKQEELDKKFTSLQNGETPMATGSFPAKDHFTEGKLPQGLSTTKVYNRGWPVQFGNVINIGGNGDGQILCAWDGGYTTTGVTPRMYYRARRDVRENWGPWRAIAFVDDIPKK